MIFFCLNSIGGYIYDRWVPMEQHKKYNRAVFASDISSTIHSLMISISASLLITIYTPIDALNASHDDTLILTYKWCATFSASYFALDALLLTLYQPRPLAEKALWIVHHIFSGMCMCSIFLTHPIIAYMNALPFLIEWSTVALNLRIFARLWGLKGLYFVFGWAVIISYPLTRIVWNAYLIWIAFASDNYLEYLSHYLCEGAQQLIVATELFVFLMSTYYYCAVIMAKPKKMYKLK